MTNVHGTHRRNSKGKMKGRDNRECGTVPACVDRRTVKLKLSNLDLEGGESENYNKLQQVIMGYKPLSGKALRL